MTSRGIYYWYYFLILALRDLRSQGGLWESGTQYIRTSISVVCMYMYVYWSKNERLSNLVNDYELPWVWYTVKYQGNSAKSWGWNFSLFSKFNDLMALGYNNHHNIVAMMHDPYMLYINPSFTLNHFVILIYYIHFHIVKKKRCENTCNTFLWLTNGASMFFLTKLLPRCY